MPLFAAASARWLPQWRPEWLAALCWQESRYGWRAVSPAGAQGGCQFMPRTWEYVRRARGWPRSASPYHPRYAIEAAAWYLARLRAEWTTVRPECDRRQLAQASYNAGLGSILRSQRACGMATHWSDLRVCLPSITGRHSAETIAYVDLVASYTNRILKEDRMITFFAAVLAGPVLCDRVALDHSTGQYQCFGPAGLEAVVQPQPAMKPRAILDHATRSWSVQPDLVATGGFES